MTQQMQGHCLATFVALGVSHMIKTNKEPIYTPQAFPLQVFLTKLTSLATPQDKLLLNCPTNY